ncbi:MAG: urease accessory protein UreF, partial [Panacagrimonas sp.]
ATTLRWIGDGLGYVLARYEAPVWVRLHRAFDVGDLAAASGWNADVLATRETHELRSETSQMGYSLLQLMRTLGHAFPLPTEGGIAYPTAHAWASTCWSLPADEGLVAYLYGWTENQVMAALKTLPLGQSAGQRVLVALRGAIDACATRAHEIPDEDLGTQSPMLAILSSRHESQYSRLFRS